MTEDQVGCSKPFYRSLSATYKNPFSVLRSIKDINYDVLSEKQIACLNHYCLRQQKKDEDWFQNHPEVIMLLQTALSNIIGKGGNMETQLSKLAHYFQRPNEELRKELYKVYGKSVVEAKLAKAKAKLDKENDRVKNVIENVDLRHEFERILTGFAPPVVEKIISESSLNITISSSFLTLETGETTPKTPEPEPERVLTLSEIFYNMVSAAVDKAVMSRFSENQIQYDIGYVFVMGIVEDAMEIVVEDIKQDIMILFENAYVVFEEILKEKQKRAEAFAWENRMRKKLKRMLRRQKNFRGYETPPSPKSQISEHPSYKLSPPQVCRCHPQFKYNRYPKDRYGIYLPSKTEYEIESVVQPIEIVDESPNLDECLN